MWNMRVSIRFVSVISLTVIYFVCPIVLGEVDQQIRDECPETFWYSIMLMAPVGQEFTPDLPWMDAVELNLKDSSPGDGLGATIQLNIRPDTIGGAIVGTSEPVDIPHGFRGIVYFDFADAVPLVPQNLYVIEIEHLGGGNFGVIGSDAYSCEEDPYPRGRVITKYGPGNDADLWFREGMYPLDGQPPVASFKSLNVIELDYPEEETTDGGHMVGGVIRFDPTESYDPDGEIQSYEWDFDGGEQIPSKDPQKPDVVFKEARVYTIRLTVTDDAGLTGTCEEILNLSLKEGDIILLRSGPPYSTIFDLVSNFYTHVGMYIGNQQMIESIARTNDRSPHRRGVVITPLSGWAYPSETYATLISVRTANDEIIQGAIDFARTKFEERQQYDMLVWQKSLNERNYYCSELIWAAYFFASEGSINRICLAR